ncbi:4-(cytidine 5'-diphospho)-2-C-methyl-D-erythritol kinase [Sneathiella chinensis]|uniref:4-diphosphocytidyl-2-C-methyl-D-erythritol kinase n=1 Tax=Sneathiella chinensis TaxID=349750 RepID=A0ABQ5U351_9PROT|nr:4-(cytidine 5'-diphospho)-2-C-methyl-D-erythritol kinase [Sneathiella chinensis]GLQ05709.1 4-diphosphocytidyl-2-C-methyl-D-erythritol kinase [Sneathiella chinensis]
MTQPGNLFEVAPPKINLFLHVTGRREDGYHLLESLAVFLTHGDRVSAQADTAVSLAVAGPFAAPLQGDGSNLVTQAAALLQSRYPQAAGAGARLTLKKVLPVASGIGGGSADAAATLRLLNRLWGLGLGREALSALGEELGADVPVCVRGRPALMSGIGETLIDVPGLPEAGILLVNPGVEVSTPQVFKALGPLKGARPVPDFSGVSFAGLIDGLRQCENDLQPAAIRLCPEIKQVLAVLDGLEGARLTRMSGSGATCFALFSSEEEARQAAQKIASDHPRWWGMAGRLDTGA